jgi:hypothetical protein
MTTQELSGQPEQPIEQPAHPIDGREVSADLHSEAIAAETRAVADATRAVADATRLTSTDREATRYLSAATQINIRYAETVVSKVINEPFRALAPTFGVDVPVVTKWALKALRTRARRDYILAAIFVLIFPLLALSFLWLQGLILFALLLIAAWQTVSWEYWERLHNIVINKMLRDRFDPGEAPSPSNESDRTRLEEVAKRRDGNLVVFSGHSAFIGSGQKLHYERLLLDVSRGREAEDGTPMDPDHFTSQDLNTAIARAFDHKTGLARSLTNIRVHERLFVNGLHIQNDELLLPDHLRPPPSSIDEDLLTAATLHPAPEARTYVCVEMPGWQGQLVVTLFIRAVHTGESLYIDWTFQGIPPLRDEFLVIDRYHELTRSRQLGASLRFSLRETIPALLRSPYVALRTLGRPHSVRRHQSRQSRMIERGYLFDYGAQRSIREEACGRRRQHYFLARDEAMYMLLAQQTLTRAVEMFLKDHNVDLGQFNEQVKVIFDNSIKVGDISNSTGVTIGDNSSSQVNDSPKGAK